MFSRIGVHHVLSAVLVSGVAHAQVTQRVSVDSNGQEGNQQSLHPAITADGRYVAFQSLASNLVPGDTNGAEDVFVRDRATGTTTRVSVGSGGIQANGHSYGASISADGRWVSFVSEATNLAVADTNGTTDVFVHDRQLDLTERVSVDSSGAQGNGFNLDASISADGRWVVFRSAASNLVPGDTNGWADIFLHDRVTGTTERASVNHLGRQANHRSWDPSVSADGRYVAFASQADNMVPGDTNGKWDIFVRDRQLRSTVRVSVDSTGTQSDADSFKTVISADGRFVGFESDATNLVPNDTNAQKDVFVHDLQTGATERATLDSNGNQGGGGYVSAISADGRFVACWADGLVPGDTNGALDIFLRDRWLGTTELVDVSSQGGQAEGGASSAAISGNGRFVAFDSPARNLLPDGDSGFDPDVFVRDRTGGMSFVIRCEPGIDGVAGCPCSNPPSGPGRGCDNSSGTGGAVLAASGGAILSSDSLVFTTSGERPMALSVLLQGTTAVPGGAIYGQGLRCVGGVLKRLYTKTAPGGAMTAPNYGGHDPTVSVRSAAKGDPISAGQSRWYLVFYRDPTVLGGCPTTSTFNATQTGEVAWSP